MNEWMNCGSRFGTGVDYEEYGKLFVFHWSCAEKVGRIQSTPNFIRGLLVARYVSLTFLQFVLTRLVAPLMTKNSWRKLFDLRRRNGRPNPAHPWFYTRFAPESHGSLRDVGIECRGLTSAVADVHQLMLTAAEHRPTICAATATLNYMTARRDDHTVTTVEKKLLVFAYYSFFGG